MLGNPTAGMLLFWMLLAKIIISQLELSLLTQT